MRLLLFLSLAFGPFCSCEDGSSSVDPSIVTEFDDLDDKPRCFTDEQTGRTIVHYARYHEHQGFKCTHEGDSCECNVKHSEHSDGHCIEFEHIDGTKHQVAGTCADPTEYPITYHATSVGAPFETKLCTQIHLTSSGTAAVDKVYFLTDNLVEGQNEYCVAGSEKACIRVGECNVNDEPVCWGVTDSTGKLMYYSPAQRSPKLNSFVTMTADAQAPAPVVTCDFYDDKSVSRTSVLAEHNFFFGDTVVINDVVAKEDGGPNGWHTCTCADGTTYECKSKFGDGKQCCSRSKPAICGNADGKTKSGARSISSGAVSDVIDFNGGISAKEEGGPNGWHTCTCADGTTYECKSKFGDGKQCCGRSKPALCGSADGKTKSETTGGDQIV